MENYAFDCSVIIPAFNAEKYISNCLDSVFAQHTDYRFEVIVIDDGSTDKTSEIVSSGYPEVRLFTKKNGGPGSARNLGVELALSDIIIFLDADDRMLPGRIEFQG